MNALKKKILNAIVEGRLLSKILNYIFIVFFLNILRNIIWCFLLIKNIDNKKIIFITFQGSYTCNPKYITNELLKENINCKIIWSLSNKKSDDQFAKQIKTVKINSLSFLKEYANSKIIVMNSIGYYNGYPLPKRKKQIIIQTWHGSLGIKKFTGENIRKHWFNTGIKNGLKTSYCISNSDFEDMVYRTTFWPNSEILKYGHPRNDILFSSNQYDLNKIKNELLSKYKINNNPKIILYAPTFRDIRNLNCYNLDYIKLLDAVKKRFRNENWVILLKFHESEKILSKILTINNVIDVSDYPDIQELISITDIAITDYSSWIYDFMLMEKPGFIYASDINDYNTERGFYYSLESTPFPIASDNDQLYDNIINFNEKHYHEKRKIFLKEKGCIDDGNASKRVVNKIKELIGDL